MASQTRRTVDRQTRRRSAIGAGVRVTLDGVAYTLHMGELSAMDASALRRETGMSVAGLLSAIQSDPDIDILAAVVWLARRQDGDRVTFDEVASGIGYDSDLTTESLPAPDVAPDPVRVAEAGGQVDGHPEA
ncbi:MAG TPA: hypothetical protein VIR27_16580 [Mycobacteriales bacterium]|jgi:hypothetical protein